MASQLEDLPQAVMSQHAAHASASPEPVPAQQASLFEELLDSHVAAAEAEEPGATSCRGGGATFTQKKRM